MLLFSTVLDINRRLNKENFLNLVLEWNRTSYYEENIIPDLPERIPEEKGGTEYRCGTEDLWLAVTASKSGEIVAVRYEKREADGVIWDSDYVVNFRTRKMAIQLHRSYSEQALSGDRSFSTPHFISLLINHGYLEDDGVLPVARTPHVLRKEDLELLASIIKGEMRFRLPVIYVSKTYYDEDPVDVKRLAGRVKGVAHVLVQEGNWLNDPLRHLCDDKNEYYGAVGIYFPASADAHRRYLYRSAEGYDEFLMEKTVSTVISYSNEQTIDYLLTWQGVKNARLEERLAEQKKERLSAEYSRKQAQKELDAIVRNRGAYEARMQKDLQMLQDKAMHESYKVLESFDDDIARLRARNAELTEAVEALRTENYGLRQKLNTNDAAALLCSGDEYEFYPGEIQEILLAELEESLKRLDPKSRRAHIIEDILLHNEGPGRGKEEAEAILKTLSGYKTMDQRRRRELKNLGFVIKEEGKHIKLIYHGDSRYQFTCAKTPSSSRSGINSAKMIIKYIH